MIRPVTCICALLAGGAGLFLYQAKHRTMMLDRQIEDTFHQIEDARQKIGILEAEWALLNSPERLAELGDKYLNLKPVVPTQFVALADLDQRLPPPRPVVAQAANPAPAEAAAPAEDAAAAVPTEGRDTPSADAAPAQPAGTATLRHDAVRTVALRRETRHDRAGADSGHDAAAAVLARRDEDIHRREMAERHRATVLAQRDAPKRAAKPPADMAVAEAAPRPRPARVEREARLLRPAPVYAAPPARPAAYYVRTPPVTGSLLGGFHAAMAPPVPVADVR